MVCGLPINLPSPARAQHIVDALRKGDTTRTISRSIDKKNRVDVRRVIERIAADVNRYDTDVDEVAVQRAYEGDQGAWLTLTHYERRACLDRLMERGLAGKGHVRWPELPAVEFSRSELGWLDYWCEAVGEDQQRFRKMLTHRRNAATVEPAATIAHGTDAGYRAHHRVGEPACRSCVEANIVVRRARALRSVA